MNARPCEQKCGRTATVYGMDSCAGGWAGYYCDKCCAALKFQPVQRLDGTPVAPTVPAPFRVKMVRTRPGYYETEDGAYAAYRLDPVDGGGWYIVRRVPSPYGDGETDLVGTGDCEATLYDAIDRITELVGRDEDGPDSERLYR